MEQNSRLKYTAQYLMVINIVIFLITLIYDFSLSVDTLVLFGAKVNYKIVDGQFYRLFSAMFLHWDFYHLLANMFALYIFGRDIETIFGKGKFLTIYFFSGLTGSLFSFIFNNSISAGASGAIFGLLGAHLYLFMRNKNAYKRIFGMDFLVLIAINVGYGFMDPRIDFSGHMGGLVGGIIICYILGIRQERHIDFKKVLAIILTIAAISGSFVFRSTYYRISENYYIHKSIDLFYSQNVSGSLSLIEEGLLKHPSSPSLNQLDSEIRSAIR